MVCIRLVEDLGLWNAHNPDNSSESSYSFLLNTLICCGYFCCWLSYLISVLIMLIVMKNLKQEDEEYGIV